MSDRFNLNDYETVKQRKFRFYSDNPDGRISVSLINNDLMEMALVKAYVYASKEDQDAGLARGMGYALELRDKERSKTASGKTYESVNFSSWLENAEESAVGRALDNAGYASNMRCSREEIEKSKRNSQAIKPIHVETQQTPMPSDAFVPDWGKYKGKNIKTEDLDGLKGYVKWLKTESELRSKPLDGKVKEFCDVVEKL